MTYNQWIKGFQAALQDKQPSSHEKSKQLYFPVNDDYHLLSPLYATSMAQQLSDKLKENFYSKENIAVRKAKERVNTTQTWQFHTRILLNKPLAAPTSKISPK